MEGTRARTLHGTVGFARRIAIDRIRGEYPRTDQAKAGSTEQPRRQRGCRLRSRAPDSGSEQARQRATRKEVDGLGPAGITEGECAHRMPSGAVIGASLTLKKGRADEERRHHHPAIDQQSRRGSWSFHGPRAYSRHVPEMIDHPRKLRSRATVLLLYGGAAAVLIAIHLATNGVLGFHTDELYYMASGRHPAFGYVDFPPIVPLLSRLETTVFGVTPWGLRVLPALVGGVNVILCGAYVRKLGGSLQLQALALLIGVTEPLILGTFLFQTVIFDQVAWMLSLYWFLAIVIDRNPRTWILLGITLGLGLEIKFLILALIAGIGLAVVLTPTLRSALRTKYPWIALALMLVIWAPNIVWQTANGLPTLTYILNHQGDIQSGGGVLDFAVLFLVLLFLLTPLWIAGFISLFRNSGLRPIGIACAVPILVYLFVGKFYYPAPTIPIVMAAGLLAMSRVQRNRLRSALAVGVVVASLLSLVTLMKITIPNTPANRLHATGLDTEEPDFAATVGWMSITTQLTTIYAALPAKERATTVIVSSDYGVSGALQIYGTPGALPSSYSPQLSDWYWLPTHVAAADVLMVGYNPSDVAWMCTSARTIAHLTVPYHVVNDEQGSPVTLCGLSEPLTAAWARLKDFS
jgi:dolichyl-phosphate-mannose-protein mannosyltransferase